MADPKPITLTQVATDGYTGPAPQPFAVVGTMPAGAVPTFTALTGAVSGATGANLQEILDDIVFRLAAVET